MSNQENRRSDNGRPARVLGTGFGFAEGPVFMQSGDIVVTSINQGRIYRVRSEGAEMIADVGGGPNGLTEGPGGRIYIAQNGGKSPGVPTPGVTGGIQVIDPDGGVRWLTTDPVSPNDLCFGPDGLLYFTDPTRQVSRPDRSDGRLWRVDVETGAAELLASVHWYPNGLGFGLEDDALYVANSRDCQIVRMPLEQSGLGKPEIVIQMERGAPDGFAFDIEGNIIIGAPTRDERPGTVQVWSPDGKLLDELHPGSSLKYTNVALSEDRMLIVTDADAGRVLAYDDWASVGLPLHPFRS